VRSCRQHQTVRVENGVFYGDVPDSVDFTFAARVTASAPDLAGYRVYWRSTTSPTWDHWRWVGNTTSATLDLVVDDAFFGVAAVNSAGDESPVVFPSPGR
jgi:hypothetical protein